MNDEIIPNYGQPVDNPLSTNIPKKESSKSAIKIDLKNPKILLLGFLVVILLILVIASVIVSLNRHPVTTAYEPTPIPTANPTPTALPVSISSDWQQKLDDTKSEINTSVDFPPPDFDTQIGM